jgi:hypothetical protein
VWQRYKSNLPKTDDHAVNVINPPVSAAPRQLNELSGPPVSRLSVRQDVMELEHRTILEMSRVFQTRRRWPR